MPKIEPAKPAPDLTVPENIHRLFVLLLALAATLVFWLEATATPATPSRQPARAVKPAATVVATATTPQAAATVPAAPVQAPATAVQSPASIPKQPVAAAAPDEFRLEKQNNVRRADWLQMIPRRLSTDVWSANGVRVEAGYGQICQLDPHMEKYSTELERPGCAFLKASFSF
jgi:hypothetical protein